MGRKKKGQLSHEELLKSLESKTEESLPKKDEVVELPTKKEPELKPQKTTRKAKPTKKIDNILTEEDDEVFDKDLENVEDDIDELTRLMSVVDIVNDPDELEKQIDLAGLGLEGLSIFHSIF